MILNCARSSEESRRLVEEIRTDKNEEPNTIDDIEIERNVQNGIPQQQSDQNVGHSEEDEEMTVLTMKTSPNA
jgi:hypothetical protein